MKTPGEIIRGLIPVHYPDSHALNLAVNEHRRLNGFKNWYAAAADLLTKHEETEMKTSKQIRAAFFSKYPTHRTTMAGGTYLKVTRLLFMEFLDELLETGQISEHLAQHTTLYTDAE